MSKQSELKSVLETVGVVVGSLVFAILIIVTATTKFDEKESVAKITESEPQQNMEPVAEVKVAKGTAESSEIISGEQIVKANCALCHTAGLMGAPKIGDIAQWAPRIETGKDTLVRNAINGIRTMPAKGGNAALTDKEMEAAVIHMVNLSGGQI